MLVFAILASILTTAVIAAEPEQIDGIYQIKTADDLIWFRDFVNANTANSGASAVLTNDIDASSISDWKTPIGNSFPYDGVFDGNGHCIVNLTYKPSLTKGKGRALFGEISEKSVVMNLGISKATIKAKTSSPNDAHVAALVGINNGLISN